MEENVERLRVVTTLSPSHSGANKLARKPARTPSQVSAILQEQGFSGKSIGIDRIVAKTP